MKTATLLLGLALCVPTAALGQDGWNYTALGDSYATGYLAGSGYVSRYKGYVATDNAVPVTLFNLGQNGWTSAQLLNALKKNAGFKADLESADVITWNIGTNDFRAARDSYKSGKCGGKDNQSCLRSTVATFNANWDGIVDQILLRRSTATTVIRTMDILNPWVAADLTSNTTADSKEPAGTRGSDFVVLGFYLEQMNSHIAISAAENGIALAEVHTAFDGVDGTEDPVGKGYIASDGIHPNDVGHEVIARTFRALGYAPLR